MIVSNNAANFAVELFFNQPVSEFCTLITFTPALLKNAANFNWVLRNL